MSERWRPVPEWEDCYEVSELGRLRSITRTIVRRDGSPMSIKGRHLNPNIDTEGYLTTSLWRNNKETRVRLHVLVLLAFIGPRPNGFHGRHLNGDRTDCRLANLAWGTPSQNNYDCVAHGRHPQARKTHCPRGHEYAGSNLIGAPGKRECRTCKNKRQRKNAAA